MEQDKQGEEKLDFHQIDEEVLMMRLPEELQKSWFNLNPVGVIKLYNLLSFPKDLFTKVSYNTNDNLWHQHETGETTSASQFQELHVYGKLS